MRKFGIIISLNGERVALPIVQAEDQDAAIVSILALDWDEIVSIRDITDFALWNNCLYSGRAVGHTVGQCTADACY